MCDSYFSNATLSSHPLQDLAGESLVDDDIEFICVQLGSDNGLCESKGIMTDPNLEQQYGWLMRRRWEPCLRMTLAIPGKGTVNPDDVGFMEIKKEKILDFDPIDGVLPQVNPTGVR